jgi:hypothetical protein
MLAASDSRRLPRMHPTSDIPTMFAANAPAVLAQAEAIVNAAVPEVRAARVPRGLFMALPVRWDEAHLVCLTLAVEGGRLVLAADGRLVEALLRGPVPPDSPAGRIALAARGLAYESEALRVTAAVAGLDEMPERAMAMARALAGLAVPGEDAADVRAAA